MCHQIQFIFNHYRFITIPKNKLKNHKKRIISLTVNSITKVHILNNVELNFLPDMFYEIFCIFNLYPLITIFRNSKIFEKAIYFIVHPNFFPVKVPFRIAYTPRRYRLLRTNDLRVYEQG